MIYVVGGNGFVGQAYVRLLTARNLPHQVITRSNYEQFRGTSCDVLINCSGNSKKYLASREPLRDFDESVRSVADTLVAFASNTYILLSSGDVYPDQSSPVLTGEDSRIEPSQQSRYGLHKALAEALVSGTHPRWLILRMGGFVGPGLKKNAIFDMLSGDPVWLSPESELQFISTDGAAALVWGMYERGIRNEVVNLGGRGVVRLAEIHRTMGSRSEFKADAPRVRFELDLEKLARLAGDSLPLSLDEVAAFLDSAHRAMRGQATAPADAKTAPQGSNRAE